MSKRIYVGNLPFSASDDEIRNLFDKFGTVTKVSLITDRDSGRPAAYVEMEHEAACLKAISALHQKDMGGRTLVVKLAER